MVNMGELIKFKKMNDLAAQKNKISLPKKILNKVRYGMTLQSVRYILMRLGIEFSPYYLFLERINETDIPDIKGVSEDYTCEFLGPEYMKEIGAINYAGFTENKLLALLKAGQKCIALKNKNEIACFMWINFTEFSYKSTVVKLKSNEAYLWFMYTMESYRGKNLAPYLRYKSYMALSEMGRNRLYSISDYFNSPAVRFKKKLNSRRLKLILYIQIFNKLHRSFTLRSYREE
jgi:hypothetical protein